MGSSQHYSAVVIIRNKVKSRANAKLSHFNTPLNFEAIIKLTIMPEVLVNHRVSHVSQMLSPSSPNSLNGLNRRNSLNNGDKVTR